MMQKSEVADKKPQHYAGLKVLIVEDNLGEFLKPSVRDQRLTKF